MVTLDLGLGQLVAAFRGALTGTDVRLGTRATALHRTTDGFQIDIERGGAHATLNADAVVLATPAFVTADLVQSLTSTSATALREVPYADVATIILTYPADSVERRMDATGFLVPPAEGRLVVGCSWLSAKWPRLASENVVVLRAMVGRAGDQRWVPLDDARLIRRVRAELAEAMGLSAEPLQTHVQRWPRALPQYIVGHQDRLDRLDVALAEVPGLHVTGAAYRGAGVAGCVAQAEEVAVRALARLPPWQRHTWRHKPSWPNHELDSRRTCAGTPTGRLRDAPDAGVLGNHPSLPTRLSALPRVGDRASVTR